MKRSNTKPGFRLVFHRWMGAQEIRNLLLLLPLYQPINHDLSMISPVSLIVRTLQKKKLYLIGGIPNPLKKHESQLGLLFPKKWKVIKFHGSKAPKYRYSVAKSH